MPPAVPRPAGRVRGVRTQAAHAREDIVLRLFHVIGLPAASWAGVGLLSAVLRLAFPGAGTAIAAAAAGVFLAGMDLYLRVHRQSFLGKTIGAATTLAVTVWLTAVTLCGWPRPVLFAYVVGGLAVCAGWVLWIAHGDHRDLSRAFGPAAEVAFGVSGSRLFGVRRSKAAVQPGAAADWQPVPAGRHAAAKAPGAAGGWQPVPAGRHATTKAVISFPPGEFVTKDAAARLEYLESALGYEAGSLSLENNPRAAGAANVTHTSPRLLTEAPLRWPGPSAPGADMRVPFRLGLLQDGREFRYPRLPIGHRKVTGVTDSGKTMSLLWNMVAEGITRTGYAAFVADVVKGDQYTGALRLALHGCETEPEGALRMLAGLHRARLARCNYLARIRATEWYPGCGLSFCEVWLEEAAGILRLLGRTQKDRDAGMFMLEEWVEDVNAARSAGISVTASYQKPVKEQAFSTVHRSQMGHVCFGVNDSEDAVFGLAELQRDRGCRPQLWGASHPGMAFWDTSTVPEEDKTMAMRHWFWGPGSEHIAAYASEWPAARRKLDDVTGEALEAVPGRPASTAFPVRPVQPAQRRPPGPRAQAAADPGAMAPLPRVNRAGRIKPEEAAKQIRSRLAIWRLEGKQFTTRDLVAALGHGVICPEASSAACTVYGCVGRTRGWLYAQVAEMARAGLLAPVPGSSPAAYEVTGDPEGEKL